MKLQNTSGFSDDLVREVIRFVKPNGVKVPLVQVRKLRHGCFRGRSWAGRRVLVRVGGPNLGGLSVRGLKAVERKGSAYLDFATLTTEESLVAVMAHELRHQYQARGRLKSVWKERIIHNSTAFEGETVQAGHTTYYNARRVTVRVLARQSRRGMVWGARGRFSERDCDAYALRMLRAWRRAHRAPVTLSDAILGVA